MNGPRRVQTHLRGETPRRSPRLSAAAREGLTLLEIVVATIILVGALAVLMPQLELARLASLRATREADAVNRAVSRLNETVALASTGSVPEDLEIDAGGGWIETVTVSATEYESLLRVTARVTHTGEADTVDADVSLSREVFVQAILDEVLASETTL